MNTPNLFITFAERLGWALLHSLWQGALIAIALAVALRLMRRESAALRHAVCLLALLALAASVAGTAWFLHRASPGMAQRARPDAVIPSAIAGTPIDIASDQSDQSGMSDRMPPATASPPWSWRGRFEPVLPMLSAAWMLGVALLSLRHLIGWRRLSALRRRGAAARADLQEIFARLLEKFGRIAGVRLLESAEAAVPMLAGLFKPAVLLPLRVISGLSEREIEAILAHELAHLVRRDAWSNLAQVAIETLLFYHPAVWWIGHRARQERENAADDLALEVCEDRRVYAEALAQLAEMHLTANAALAATGGSLLARIRRIVRPEFAETTASGWSAGIPALLTALALTAIFHVRADNAKAIPVVPVSPATSETRNRGVTLEVEPVVGPDSYTIELSLVPQAAEFEGFVNYGSPIANASPAFQIGSSQTVITPNVINQPFFNTRKVTTSVSIFDGHPVLIGGLVRGGDWKTISVAAENQPAAKAAEEPPRKADDAKTWIADVFQLDDKATREAAIERIRTAMTSGNADDARAGVMAFVQLGPIEFDKASFRPAVRALLASEDAATRAAAVSAFTMTGADPDDLPRIYALADDAADEVRARLTPVIVQLKIRELRDTAASEAILKLMANLPRDSRSVAHALWGANFSPKIEARVLEFCRDIDGASNSSVGYNFFYGALSTQANKSEASCKRLIELLAHPDTTNIAGRSAWGLQQGVAPAQFALVAEAMVKVIEARSDGYLRENALRCLRAYGDAAQAPALKAVLAKPGVAGDFRKMLEETLAVIEARPAGRVALAEKVAADIFLNAFLACGAGEKQEVAGNKSEALASWKRAISLLDQISREHPAWKAEMVKRRRELASQAVARIESVTGEGVALSSTPPAALPPEKAEIEVEWNGQWWPAAVLKKDGEKTQIHYVGFGSEWDEWVMAERVRPIAETQSSKTEAEKKKEEDASRVEKNRQAARRRAADDRQTYQPAELSEIESLYQVANKNWRSEEARTSLKKLLEKFDHANRTGCATLYMGQMSEGQERLDYLTRAVEKFSDCYYFDGCQVGGYGRLVLALALWEKGEKDKARALFAELKTIYKDATDHKGRPMGEVAEAAEKELAAQQ